MPSGVSGLWLRGSELPVTRDSLPLSHSQLFGSRESPSGPNEWYQPVGLVTSLNLEPVPRFSGRRRVASYAQQSPKHSSRDALGSPSVWK